MIRFSRNAFQGSVQKTALVGSSVLLFLSGPALGQTTGPAASPQGQRSPPVAAAETPAAVRGAILSISPLRVELDGEGAAQTLRLANAGARTLVVQTRVFAWKQTGASDQYEQSNQVIASPSIATIPPGQTQIVRMLRTGSVSNHEQPFRIAIDQLPDANAPEASAAATRLRFLVPMFVDRSNAAPARLEWKNTPGGIQISNSGGRTVRIASIKVLNAAGQELPVANAGLRYVMPGNASLWPMTGGCTSGAARIMADIDEAKIDATLSPCS